MSWEMKIDDFLTYYYYIMIADRMTICCSPKPNQRQACKHCGWRYYSMRSNGDLTTDLLVLANPRGLMQSHFLRVKLTYCLSLSTPPKAAKTHLGNQPLLSLSEPQTEYTRRRTEKQGQLVDRQHSSAMCGPIC